MMPTMRLCRTQLLMGRACTILVVACMLSGCVSWFSHSAGYDKRPYTIQSLPLFDQKMHSTLSQESWNGDWIFRRKRLAMVDAELRRSKPDLLVMQEVMSRRGSSSEDDIALLAAGALAGYESERVEVREFDDTFETESLAVMMARPLAIMPMAEDVKRYWTVGNDGHMAAFLIATDDQPMVVIDVKMPADLSKSFVWYTFIQERAKEFLESVKLCPERMILAGYIPGDQSSARFQEFLMTLQSKSTTTGFCQVASDCFTSAPSNDLFTATIPADVPAHNDRIFVHQAAYVFSAARTMVVDDPNVPYARKFGLKRLWPTQRFGWSATVLLPRCPK